MSDVSGCSPAAPVCPPTDRYRSICGVCNNRLHPWWGAANTPLVRWLPAEYEDGQREPKGWNPGRLHGGFRLPAPRDVSKQVVRSSCKRMDKEFSQLLVDWGQYIDHDISFTPQASAAAASNHSACDNVDSCFPIQTGQSPSGEPSCLRFRRSLPACSSWGSTSEQATQRQQLNIITSFVDASVVYGHTPAQQQLLRNASKLAVNQHFRDAGGRAFLPFVAAQPSACRQDPAGGRVECFAAGDSRSNEALGLSILHTLWLREHNRIADALAHINSHWSAETLYQETRKIIGALHQIVTMRDYVPKILGPESCERHMGSYRGYDPSVNPSVANVFSTAAFRFGHGTLAPVIKRLNETFQDHEVFPHLKLHDTLFSPWRIVKEGGIEPVLRGMIGSSAGAASADTLLHMQMTEQLVVLGDPQLQDLASLNLQRGRDHALPGYNAWRTFCGLKRIETLDDLVEVVQDAAVAQRIFQLYKHPDNIDVWLGGLAENFLPGARTGPLFACLIGRQMKALRDGDRFWWEAEGVFTPQQKVELLKASISRIICDNSEVRDVPLDAFRFSTFPSGYVSCDHVPAIDLGAWREGKSHGSCGVAGGF